jgi:hypothetical protein
MKRHLKLILAYLKEQWMWTVFIGYEIFAMLLGIFTHYDIAIPCMSKLLLDKECPGCGMTRGTMCLLQGDFQGAAHFNSGVFIVLPLIIGIIIFDFFQFKNKRFPLLLTKGKK